MSKIDDLLASESEAAEQYELPEHLPAHVRVERPTGSRGAVVSVRLSEEEHARLRQAAEVANLPVSTLMRLWTLDRLHDESHGGGRSVAARLDRLERTVYSDAGTA